MKVRLLAQDLDVDLEASLPSNSAELIQDLGLDTVIATMAAGDRYLYHVAERAPFQGLRDVGAIRYRQEILVDLLEHPGLARELYGLVVATIEKENRIWGYSHMSAEALLHRSVAVLEIFVEMLRRLRETAVRERPGLRSAGLTRLFDEIAAEVSDGYLHEVEAHLKRLHFADGIHLTAQLGLGNRGVGFVLRRRIRPMTWRERVGLGDPDTYTWVLPDRDEAGADALARLRGRGVALAADSLARSTDHISGYFARLRAELAFYICYLNLHAALTARGVATCIPVARAPGETATGARRLVDVALSLSSSNPTIGNDIATTAAGLIVVTGANRGGKSTFLRSLGQAQLMMEAGMFVAAEAFEAEIRGKTFTHFRRPEDPSLKSGKFDEELGRLSRIVDAAAPGSFILFNESFSSTNEREGSEIARQVVHALLDAGVKVAYVTHMFDLADRLRGEGRGDALFLRAERLADGRRTFRVVPGDPLPTSHGLDIYRRVFGRDIEGATPTPAGALGAIDGRAPPP